MTCLSPLKLVSQGIEVPCGRCRACRVNRAEDWSLRMLHESEYYETSSFVTLTIDDDHIEFPAEVSKDEFQRFMKRLRKELKGRQLKYFACGEYGSLLGRPHYHAVIFGLGSCGRCRVCTPELRMYDSAPVADSDCAALEAVWTSGYVDSRIVNPERFRYVADYVQKDTRPSSYSVIDSDLDGREPPFGLMSKGLGLRWMMDNLSLSLSPAVRVKGRRVNAPRYYRRKILERFGTMRHVASFVASSDARKRHVYARGEELVDLRILRPGWLNSTNALFERTASRLEALRQRDELRGRNKEL